MNFLRMSREARSKVVRADLGIDFVTVPTLLTQFCCSKSSRNMLTNELQTFLRVL
jgi:hypothetical protein